jgi:hypothetical protein
MAYYTDVGPRSGPLLWRDHSVAIDVLERPGDRDPIGTAMQVRGTPGGLAIWEITIRGKVVPGRWVVVGRQFRPAE